MKPILLSGDWTLYYAPETHDMPGDPGYLRQAGEQIPAQVPGNVELDLYRARKEPEPFYGENIYRFRKYEFYCWQFERDFMAPPSPNGSRWVLVFEGLNSIAQVFLNDKKVGESANAFIAHAFDVTDQLRYGQPNRLTVRISSSINAARKAEMPAVCANWEIGEFQWLRMPASSFGWDIMGRFLSAGMWREVRLEERQPTRILEAYYATRAISPDGGAELTLRYRYETDADTLDGFELQLEGQCGESVFSVRKNAYFVGGGMNFHVPNAKLWWPRGYGEQPLYTVTLTLLHHGQIMDQRTERIGIRRLELTLNPAPGDAGEFLIRANGCPILCKGSNWVPLDALHSRDAARLPAAMALLADAGCNIVRCWGGNVYEDHPFFDACDKMGLMVWQDFAMACAIYPPTDAFAAVLAQEATAVVQKLRNHPSILLWAGDNEVDQCIASQGFASEENKYNRLTRETLPQVVRMHDPYRPFLPSSPYIPAGMREKDVPEQHNWGPRAYFKDDFYKHSSAHFISECGYHGCPAVKSLRRFIPENELNHWMPDGKQDSDVWATHETDYLPFGRRGYSRIALMQNQVKLMFGAAPDQIEAFTPLSQIVQAEAKKFFIERTRLRKWRRTGIIWWNMLDGWPQISDAVVDYYFEKKLAYHYIRRVQQPIAVIVDESEGWNRQVFLCNDSRESKSVRYKVWDADSGEILLSGEQLSPANENVALGHIHETDSLPRLYLISWEIDGILSGNHYLKGNPPFDGAQLLGWVRQIAALPQAFCWDEGK